MFYLSIAFRRGRFKLYLQTQSSFQAFIWDFIRPIHVLNQDFRQPYLRHSLRPQQILNRMSEMVLYWNIFDCWNL